MTPYFLPLNFMKLFDVPFIPSGYKTALAGWGTIFIGIGGLSLAIGKFLIGEGDIQSVVQSFLILTGGLSVLGIGDKIEKNKN